MMKIIKKSRGLLSSNIRVMMISAGLWRIGGGMAWAFFSIYVLQLGGDYIHIGIISAVSAIVSLIPAFFGGYLADTVGRKKMVYSMSYLLAFNSVIYLFAQNWKWLLVGRTLDSIFNGLRNPAMQAILADSTTTENRARSFGMWQTIPPIFGLLSPRVTGILIDSIGFIPAQKIAYFVLLLSSSIGAYLRHRFLTETLPSDAVEKVTPLTIVKETFNDFKETREVITKQLWILIIIGIIFKFGVSIGTIYFATFAIEDMIHLSASQWGLINTISILVGILVSMPSARLVDRYGRLKMVQTSLVLTPVAMLSFTYSRGFNQTLLAYTIITILGSVGSVASQALFTDLSPRIHRGRIIALTTVIGGTTNYNSLMGGGGTIIGAAGNLVGGFLYQEGTYMFPMILMAGVVELTALLAIIFVKEPKEKEE